jgi:hypothetical protein
MSKIYGQMEIVLQARLHAENGSMHVIEYPELKGEYFHSFKEKERFKRRKITEIYGKNIEETPEFKRADFIFETVQLPEGVTTLPKGWEPEPIPIPKPIVKPAPKIITPNPEEYYVSRTPKFKCQTTTQ